MIVHLNWFVKIRFTKKCWKEWKVCKMNVQHSTLKQQNLDVIFATVIVKTWVFAGAVFLFSIGIVMPIFGCQITKPTFEDGLLKVAVIPLIHFAEKFSQ